MSDLTREPLRRAADYIMARLRRRSPSERIGASWRLSQRSDGSVHLVTSDVAGWATNIDARHPLFGDREHWYPTNLRHPSRTDWASRAVDEAIDVAVNQMADEYIRELETEIR